MAKSKKLAFSILLIVLSLSVSLFLPIKNISAYTSTPSGTITSDDLWDSDLGMFTSGLNKVVERLGELYTSAQSGTAYNSQQISQQISNNTNGFVIKLGGLTWVATYLSQANNENKDVILTLWLTDSKQLTTPTSTWSSGWYNLYNSEIKVWNYPSNMYGTSYIRAVTLNNGGVYSYSETGGETKPTDTVGHKIAEQQESNQFALFTMDKYELANYIVSPNKVSWQIDYNSSFDDSKINSRYPNSFLGQTASQMTLYPSTYLSQTLDDGTSAYTAWGNDKLWLPSLVETGYGDDTTIQQGLWQTTTNMRTNNIKQNSALISSWLRSGYNYARYASYVSAVGNDTNVMSVSDNYSVRPAFHLNLTQALDNVYIDPNAGVSISFVSLTISGTMLFGLLAWLVNINKQKQFLNKKAKAVLN